MNSSTLTNRLVLLSNINVRTLTEIVKKILCACKIYRRARTLIGSVDILKVKMTTSTFNNAIIDSIFLWN